MPRILIIDDDAQIRMMLSMTFEDAGYKVENAPDGKTGINLYKQKPADIVITDLIMPEKEGIETILELRQGFPDAKIIAISGGGKGFPGTYLDLAERLGAQLTFSKPFDVRDLLMAVKKILG